MFRVLVVEDMSDAAETLAAVLQLWGCEVEIAYDGFAALAAVKSFAPHAILADIGLPGMTGFDLAKSVKADPASNHVLLIATTGYGDAAAQKLAKAAGFADHFVKPIDIDALRTVLDKHRQAVTV